MQDQKNLIMMIIFSVVIIFGFQVFFAAPEKKAQKPGTTPVAAGKAGKTGPGTTGPATAGKTGTTGTGTVAPRLARAEAIKASERIQIRTPKLTGSISLKGALVDDLTLLRYWTTLKNEKNVDLLNPARSKDAYFVEFGWFNGADAKPILSRDDLWSVDGNRELRPDAPVTLVLKKAGLEFRRTFKIDEDYMISVTQAVKNVSGSSVKLFPFSRIRLLNEPETQGFFILHEGPLAVHRKKADERGVQDEPSYGDVREKPFEYDSVGGWLGFTDHYWLVALIPNQKGTVKGRFSFEKTAAAGEDKGWFKAEYFGVIHTLDAGKSLSVGSRVFAGAKESDLLKRYQDKDGIDRFEWAIDWGWFWFFTKPFLWLLKWFFGWVGNFGVAIILLTILVKLTFFPLANRSYKSMSKMKKLQPELVKLRERFADDKQRINQEMMALYRKEKVNPAAGCLPIIVQIPVFFALYKVLFVAIEMRHAPFFGWVQDLSAKDPTSIINLFGLLPFTVPTGGLIEFISIGIWPIIMGITMFLQQKLNPAPADPMQQKIFMFLPFIFTFMLASFPAGLVVYWACNNILSIAQQWTIMRQQGVYDTGGKGPTNVKELETAEKDDGGGSGEDDDGDGDEEETPKKKGPVKPAANTRANPGRSKQSRNKPPASKSKGRKPRGRSGSRPKR